MRKTPAEACNFIKKETLEHVIFCKFCKISKNTFSYRTLSVAASGKSEFTMYACKVVNIVAAYYHKKAHR